MDARRKRAGCVCGFRVIRLWLARARLGWETSVPRTHPTVRAARPQTGPEPPMHGYRKGIAPPSRSSAPPQRSAVTGRVSHAGTVEDMPYMGHSPRLRGRGPTRNAPDIVHHLRNV